MNDFISPEARRRLIQENSDSSIEGDDAYVSTLTGMQRFAVFRAMFDPACEVAPAEVIQEFREE
ncbi:MAG: hypothetical protein Q7T41_00020 [Candidatus Saccharibacteria bacterium]|nr:hypothetical protein [Candidatus Saccharibacteria bacterium]